MERGGASGPLREEGCGIGRDLRESREGPRHVGGGEGESFEAGVVQVLGAAVGKKRGQKVQAGAKAQFGNVEPVAKAGREAVAGKKDVAGFGKAAGKREVGVVKGAADGDDLVAPIQIRLWVWWHLRYPGFVGEWARAGGMTRVDVTIRGAGIFGLSIAFACARRGARVRVIDPGGVGAGSSGGLVGALAPHVPEAWNDKKQFQLESLLMAEGWWGEVVSVSGLEPGHLRSGRLQPLADARAVEVARAREATAAVLWGDAAVWRVEAAPAGWGPLSPTGLVVRDTLTARLSPRMGLAALAAGVAALGGEVLRDGDEAGLVVDATGVAGLAALSSAVGRPAGGGVKGQAASLRFEAGNAPQIFVDALHVVPHADGTVAIGSTSENVWQDMATDAALEALIAKAVAAVPMLAGAEVVERWAGVRPRARSRAPMLGAWPGRAGWFVANGGFKIGFGMAPKVAEVMADLVLDGRDGVPEGFRVEASL